MLMMGGFNAIKIANWAVLLEAKTSQVVLDGSDGVQNWNDRSPTAWNFTQSNATKRFLWVPDGMNGRPVLRGDGTKWLSGALKNISTVFSAVCVFKPAADAAVIDAWFALEYSTGVRAGLSTGLYGSEGYTPFAVSSATYAPPKYGAEIVNAPTIVTMSFDGVNRALASSWVFRINGTPCVLGAVTGFATISTASYVGAFQDGASSYPINGDLAVVGLAPEVFTLPKFQYLERGYGKEYGIAVA